MEQVVSILINCKFCDNMFKTTNVHKTHSEVQYTLQPHLSYFKITTFRAKSVFLVFNMVHTMNKLTYEYKIIQFYNNLVDLQCKCMRLDTPRIGPILGFSGVEQSKVFLKIWIFKKPTTCFSPKLNFGEKHVVRFFNFKNFKNTFDCSTPAYFW